jgi:hypothetical protein
MPFGLLLGMSLGMTLGSGLNGRPLFGPGRGPMQLQPIVYTTDMSRAVT